MKNNQIIITINSIEDREKYQKLGITKFAYPLADFCVGMPNVFSYAEVSEDGYLFVNRILDNEGIDKLKDILDKVKCKGIIFDDLGVLELVKDKKMEKILFLSHFNTNKESIRIYLEYVDSVIVSSDITYEEIKLINEEFKGKLTLFTLGYVSGMYSRRLLVDNYSKFHHLKKENPIEIIENDVKFLVYENDYGTIFYHKPIFNGLELMNLDAQYYFINSAFLASDDIINLLNNTYQKEFDRGFLDKETIYKLKGE